MCECWVCIYIKDICISVYILWATTTCSPSVLVQNVLKNSQFLNAEHVCNVYLPYFRSAILVNLFSLLLLLLRGRGWNVVLLLLSIIFWHDSLRRCALYNNNNVFFHVHKIIRRMMKSCGHGCEEDWMKFLRLEHEVLKRYNRQWHCRFVLLKRGL